MGEELLRLLSEHDTSQLFSTDVLSRWAGLPAFTGEELNCAAAAVQHTTLAPHPRRSAVYNMHD